jgi:hypothetical protein
MNVHHDQDKVDYAEGFVFHDPEALGRNEARSRRTFAKALRRPQMSVIDQYLAAYRSMARRPEPAQPLHRALVATLRVGARSGRTGVVPGLRPKRWIGRAIRLVMITLVGPMVAMALALGTYVGANWGTVEALVALAEKNVACAGMAVVRDAENTIIDARPLLTDAECPQPLDKEGKPLARPTLSIPLPEADVTRVSDDIAQIEGAYTGSQTVMGLDPLGVARKLRSYFRSFVLRKDDHAGFSSPITTTFEILVQQPESQQVPNKILTQIAAMIFVHRHLPTDLDRARFITLLPAVLEGGVDRSGTLASLALFGKAAPGTLAERCLFASASGHSIPLADAGMPSNWAARRWSTAIGPRAGLCVRKRSASQAEASLALAELRRLCGDHDLCMTPKATAGADDDVINIRLRQLVEIASRFGPRFQAIPAALQGAETVLRDARRLFGRDDGLPLAVTIVPSVQKAVNDEAWAMRRQLGADVQVTAAVVDLTTDEPRLLAVSTTLPSGAIFPPAMPAEETGWAPGTPPFRLGSLNKIAIALLAVRQGVGTVCGDTGCMTLARAFSTSDTPAFRNLVKDLGAEMIAPFRYTLGYVGTPSDMATYSLPEDAVHGSVVRLPVADLFRLAGAILHGHSRGLAVFASGDVAGELDLGVLGLSADHLVQMRKTMAAPFLPGGTLQDFPHLIRVPGCALALGKTGTFTAGKINFEREALLIHNCGNRVLATFAIASTDNPSGLSGLISHDYLAPLHEAAVAAVMQADQP